jgi:hypothetical protein
METLFFFINHLIYKFIKKFISTKFFLALREASQKGTDIDARVLEHGYDKFVRLLFLENAVSSDRVAYHNALVYTRVELAVLTEIPEKKRGALSPQSDTAS